MQPDDPYWEQNKADRIERNNIAIAIDKAIPPGCKLTNILIVLSELSLHFAHKLGKPTGRPKGTPKP